MNFTLGGEAKISTGILIYPSIKASTQINIQTNSNHKCTLVCMPMHVCRNGSWSTFNLHIMACWFSKWLMTLLLVSFFIHLLSSLEINQIEVIRMRNGHFRPLSSDYWLPTQYYAWFKATLSLFKDHCFWTACLDEKWRVCSKLRIFQNPLLELM